MTSCHKHVSKTDSTAPIIQNEEKVISEGPALAPAQTIAIAEVKEVFPTNKLIPVDEICANHPCTATVNIVSISQFGSDYHGFPGNGESVQAVFDFTLDATNEIYPELNEHLPGLKTGDYFQAELFLNPDVDWVRIKLYQKIQE